MSERIISASGGSAWSHKNVKLLKISSTKSQLLKLSRIFSHASCLSSGMLYFQTTSVLQVGVEGTVTLSASLYIDLGEIFGGLSISQSGFSDAR